MKKLIVFLLAACLLFSMLLSIVSFLTGSDSLTVVFTRTIDELLDSIMPCVIVLAGIVFVMRSVFA